MCRYFSLTHFHKYSNTNSLIGYLSRLIIICVMSTAGLQTNKGRRPGFLLVYSNIYTKYRVIIVLYRDKWLNGDE